MVARKTLICEPRSSSSTHQQLPLFLASWFPSDNYLILNGDSLTKLVLYWGAIKLWWWRVWWGSNNFILNVVFKTSPSNPLSHENIPGAGLGSGSQIFLSREARGTYGSREASNLMMYHRLLNLGTMNIWGSIILCYEWELVQFRCLARIVDFYISDAIALPCTQLWQPKQSSDIAKCPQDGSGGASVLGLEPHVPAGLRLLP